MQSNNHRHVAFV